LDKRQQLAKLKYSYFDGSGTKRSIIVKKGDSVKDVIQKCLKRLVKTHDKLTGAVADTFMMIKADFILPNHILLMDYLALQINDGSCDCGGKQQCQKCIFEPKEIDVNIHDLQDPEQLSDLESVKPDKRDKITIDEGPICKIIERRVYEDNRYIFPYYNWKAFEISGYRR
jgi:protein FAM50